MKAASGLALACVTELFPTAYDQIRARVEQVDPVMYDRTRNFTDGKISYLSPYISRGILSGKKVQDNVLSKGYWYGEIETFLKELAWREYFQRIQQVQNKLEADLRAPQSGVLHHLMVQALEQANTGIHALDTAINTLYTTGYLHNHLRMFLASLACNIARAHWRMPARWMYYHLLDGDIASNTCSWQWVAGSFSNKKYFCNQENINTYTRTSQHQTFLDRPYDELSEMEIPAVLGPTIELNLTTHLPTTPLPKIDTSLPTLLYTSYNLDPYWRVHEKANRILLLEPSHFKKHPVSERVLHFILELAKNIENIQVFSGELYELLEVNDNHKNDPRYISKEHPLFQHFPGTKDPRDWIYPEVTGYYPSFFSYWRQCQKALKNRAGLS